MTVTAAELQAALEEGLSYEFIDWQNNKSIETIDDSEFWHEGYYNGPFEIPGLGTLEYVDGETGGEGSAEYIWQVWKIGDQYFKKEGYYMSHHGSEWDGEIFEVVPFEKTVTDWKTK